MGVSDVDEAMRRAAERIREVADCAEYMKGYRQWVENRIHDHLDPVIAALKAQLASASNSGVDEREAELIRQDCRLEQQLGRRIGELEKRIAVYEHLFPATTAGLAPIDDAEATTILERHYVHKEWKLRAEELERELAEARKDTERLDWLELMQLEEDVRRVILWPAYSQGHNIHLLLRGDTKSFLGFNLREAIDKARSTTPTKGADTQST